MTDSKAMNVIDEYVDLKKRETALDAEITNLKPKFIEACEGFAEQTIDTKDAVIYRRETPKYEYSDEIKTLEDTVKKLKKEFQLNNAPIGSTVVWAVDLKK